MLKTEFCTPRLSLRQWRDEDLDLFAAMNADPRVMEHFPETLTPQESAAVVKRIQAHFLVHGFGLWAIEVLGGPSFIGFTGLQIPAFEAPFTPCVEIGWRLAYAYWGRGYATEAALAVIDFAFSELGLAEVVAMTAPANVRSKAVMERIGMTYDPGADFDHPGIPAGHQLCRHVLYRIRRRVEPAGISGRTGVRPAAAQPPPKAPG